MVPILETMALVLEEKKGVFVIDDNESKNIP